LGDNTTTSGRGRTRPFRLGRRVAVLIALLLAASAGFAQPAAGEASRETRLFSQIDAIVKELSEITGLEARHKVGYSIIGRDRLKTFLEERVKEEIKPEEIRVEQLLLHEFGFLPAEFDLKATMIELYTEQAAAFYDFQRKKLVVLESDDNSMQHAALVHELAHALADQHFHLKKYLDQAGKNDDGALARMAVMEGQATWLMAETLVRDMGKSLLTSNAMVELMNRMIGSSSGQFPVFDKAPLYIRESLLFPYTSGMKFQQAVIKKYGQAGFSRVFRQPPATTQNILHPATYFEGRKLEQPRLPKLARQGRYRKLAEGVVGEFDFAILLQQYVNKKAAHRVAPGWRAGAYRLFEDKRDKHLVLIHASQWDTPETAGEFFRHYRTILDGKWEDAEFSATSGAEYAGTGGGGHFLVRLSGSTVYSVEGLRSPEDLRGWPKP